MPEAATIHTAADGSAQMSTTRAVKQICNVMLAIMVVGLKLTLYFIFKLKSIPKESFFVVIIVRAYQIEWMTEKLRKHWMNVVLECPICALRQPSVLSWKNFCTSATPGIKAKTHLWNELVVISGRMMTKLLQSLEVVINQPFMVTFRQAYNQRITTTYHNLCLCRRMKLQLSVIRYVKIGIPSL